MSCNLDTMFDICFLVIYYNIFNRFEYETKENNPDIYMI